MSWSWERDRWVYRRDWKGHKIAAAWITPWGSWHIYKDRYDGIDEYDCGGDVKNAGLINVDTLQTHIEEIIKSYERNTR